MLPSNTSITWENTDGTLLQGPMPLVKHFKGEYSSQ